MSDRWDHATQHYMTECAWCIGEMLRNLTDSRGSLKDARHWSLRAEGNYMRAMLSSSGEWSLPAPRAGTWEWAVDKLAEGRRVTRKVEHGYSRTLWADSLGTIVEDVPNYGRAAAFSLRDFSATNWTAERVDE